MIGEISLRIDPSFAEALAWRALQRLEALGERDALDVHHRRAADVYTLPGGVLRERAFAALALREITDLRLLAPIADALRERPAVASRADRALVGEADGRAGEGVTCDTAGRSLGLRLTAARFDDPGELFGWCRHALGHAEDTLDPSFGFEPGWDASGVDAALATRLHALWDVSVDGRAARAARPVPGASPARHEVAIAALLPVAYRSVATSVVERLWSGERPSFAELRDLAADPARLVGAASAVLPAGRCPLCSFPSGSLVVPEADLAAVIAREYPTWRRETGLCERCLDRYLFAAARGPA